MAMGNILLLLGTGISNLDSFITYLLLPNMEGPITIGFLHNYTL